MTQRFFIPAAWLTPPTVTLQGETAHQIKNVLRLKPGAEIIVLDNSGAAWQVKLTEVGQDKIQGQLTVRQAAGGEPGLHLTLYQGMLKAQKFEWVLQKGTELGVNCFVPMICQRSVVNDFEAIAKKRARWERIIQEAAEQSRRGKLPRLEGARSFAEAIQQARSHPLSLMPWEEMGGSSLKEALAGTRVRAMALFIGPEGGFTADEAALARDNGLQLVHLGPRILRAETAGLALCSVILYERGEWQTPPGITPDNF